MITLTINDFRSPLLFPAGPKATPRVGHIDLLSDPRLARQLGLISGIAGSAPNGGNGYNTEGDVITQTTDGRDLREIWTEFQQTVAMRNGQRQALVDFLTYTVTSPTDMVPQFGTGADFEVASEFGVPQGVRVPATTFNLGFAFEWYDIAGRFTWKYLAEASAGQIESVHQAVLEADNRNVFREVMATLFDPLNRTTTITGNAYNVYTLYNADGTVPPQYKTSAFDGTHTHYFVSGAATVDSGDLDQMQTAVEEHGYTPEAGVDLVLMVNKAQGDVIRQFRSIANGGTALYDFIPANNTPSFLLPTTLRVPEGTTRPAAQLRGMKVIGSYGDLTIVQEDYIPAGYMVVFGTGGSESLSNPIGIREHANPQLRGLRLVKGRDNDYPLQDSYYQRGFGTGIRQRGSAAVMQIKASGSYATPAAYTR